MLKTVILTVALCFALAAGTAVVLQERPATAKEPQLLTHPTDISARGPSAALVRQERPLGLRHCRAAFYPASPSTAKSCDKEPVSKRTGSAGQVLPTCFR